MHAVLLLSLASLARASPLISRHVLARRDSAPSGFVKIGVAPSDATFELNFQLTNSDIAGLEDRLKVVSSPSSAEYGNWLSRDEVNVFVAPTQESLSAVNAFLATQGLAATPVSPGGDVVAVNVTVAQANALFDTEYYTFQSTDTGNTTIRALEYSVPASLQGHLSYVHPTTIFPTFKPKNQILKAGRLSGIDVPIQARTTDPKYEDCTQYITPACIQHMYGVPTDPATATANANDSITVTSYNNEFAQRADLELFLEEFRTDIDPATTYTVKGIATVSDPQGPDFAGIEADLDIEYTVGLATGIPVTNVIVAPYVYDDGSGGFLLTARVLAAHSDTSHVVTTSYGGDEDELTLEAAQALCNEYLQLSAMGITVVFSSGDGGVSGIQNNDTCTTFLPTFPSGCPYVLSVGATQYNGTEVAADFSTGGFSNIYPRPWYQEKAVSSYLEDLGDTYEGLYNASGRAFPDVAAIGTNAIIAYQGEFWYVDGTSVSAPVFASVIAILNDKLLAAGKPTLGFIQPLLYENPHALTDIKHGSNPGCGTDGFAAGSGWDPVTGLGVPDFDSLMKIIGFHK